MPDLIRRSYVRSAICRSYRQKRVIRALGLRRLHYSRIMEDTPSLRGMVAKVSHLVEVEPVEKKKRVRAAPAPKPKKPKVKKEAAPPKRKAAPTKPRKAAPKKVKKEVAPRKKKAAPAKSRKAAPKMVKGVAIADKPKPKKTEEKTKQTNVSKSRINNDKNSKRLKRK